MKVVVVGATGVLGRNVLPRLRERGHEVRAVVRKPEQAKIYKAMGYEVVLGDILDLESLLPAAAGCSAALHLATAIPKSLTAGDWRMNDRVRREGTRNLLAAAIRAGVSRYVQQSITMIYGEHGHEIVDESVTIKSEARLNSAVDMEQQVQASTLEWSILRGSYFYGPGTGMEDGWRESARQGTLRLPGDGSGLISLIHVADMARAVVLAMESAPRGSIYNVVDDEPVSYKDLYTYVTAQLGLPDPQAGGPALRPSLGCSNARIKKALGWSPAYSTFRSGLA
jgi:nucleoside-diphosphate-sugar epimerase